MCPVYRGILFQVFYMYMYMCISKYMCVHVRLTVLPHQKYTPAEKIIACSQLVHACDSHVTYHVTAIGFDGTGHLPIVVTFPLAWNRNQTLIPHLELNGGSHTAILLLYACRGGEHNVHNTPPATLPKLHHFLMMME